MTPAPESYPIKTSMLIKTLDLKNVNLLLCLNQNSFLLSGLELIEFLLLLFALLFLVLFFHGIVVIVSSIAVVIILLLFQHCCCFNIVVVSTLLLFLVLLLFLALLLFQLSLFLLVSTIAFVDASRAQIIQKINGQGAVLMVFKIVIPSER